jgi:hypothetical protein
MSRAEEIMLIARRGARTTPINPGKIICAITGIYKAAGLKRPHITFADSPLALALRLKKLLQLARRENDIETGQFGIILEYV